MTTRYLLLTALVVTSSFLSTSCKRLSASPIGPLPSASGSAVSAEIKTVNLMPAVVKRLGIKVEPAGRTSAVSALRVPGTLDYDLTRYAEIGALLEGRISSVKATIGDRVKKGQVLATMLVPSIANAQADYLTAAAAASAAKKNLAREQSLLSRELTTAREEEAAQNEAAKTSAELAAAAAKLRALRVGIPDDHNTVGGAGTHLLTAPIDGVVVRRDAVLGGFLEPNKTAFAVADLSHLWANLEIYESDIHYIRIGAKVAISVDAIPGQPFDGTVKLVDPQLGKASRSVHARVLVANPEEKLRPGMFVRASIELSQEEAGGRLLIPACAVQPLGDEDVVFVERSEGKYQIRPIQVARRTADVVEVAQGLSQGEPIVVEGGFFLRGEVTRQ